MGGCWEQATGVNARNIIAYDVVTIGVPVHDGIQVEVLDGVFFESVVGWGIGVQACRTETGDTECGSYTGVRSTHEAISDRIELPSKVPRQF